AFAPGFVPDRAVGPAEMLGFDDRVKRRGQLDFRPPFVDETYRPVAVFVPLDDRDRLDVVEHRCQLRHGVADGDPDQIKRMLDDYKAPKRFHAAILSSLSS